MIVSSYSEDMNRMSKEFETHFWSLWNSLPVSKQTRIKEILALAEEREALIDVLALINSPSL